jgi:periplasmic divalent cation tolerance protein
MKMKNYIQVVTTTENKEDAQKIATDLVGKRLVACVQVIGPVSSTYWWREKIEEAEEWLCIMKSRKDLYEQIEKALKHIHPYEEPEILATPIVEGSRSYLAWLDEQVSPG